MTENEDNINNITIDIVDNSVLGKASVVTDDIKSVLSNRHRFRVIYTENDTYLTKDPSFEPKEDVIGTNLFEGLV